MKKLLLLFLVCLLTTRSFAQTYELVSNFSAGAGPNNTIKAMGVDGTGDIFLGGSFTSYNGTTRNYIARVNADGTLDTDFDPTTVVTSSVSGLLVHSDNSVTVINGAGSLIRLDNLGAEFSGASFTPDVADDFIDVVASDGTTHGVYIGGDFTDIGGTTVGRLAKLDADGSLNTTFNTNLGTGFNDRVRAIAVSGSGKILVSGDFTSFDGVTRHKIAILNSDGTLDTSFDPGTTLLSNYSLVESLAFQEDGKILSGSYNTSVARGRVIRFLTDGTSDFATSITGAINIGSLGIGDIISNGTDDILIAIQSAGGIVSLDYTTGAVVDIRTGNGTGGGSAAVNAMVQLSDASIVIGGNFTHYNALPADNLAKIATCTVSIDTEPENAAVCETNNTSFTVVASGSGTMLYQWQESTDSYNYSDISNAGVFSDATTATLTITGATSGMNGYYYRCIVTDDDCSSTTSVNTLTVTSTQAITSQPMDHTVCQGVTNGGFTVTISNTTDGYQWQEDTGSGAGFADLVDGDAYTGVNTAGLTVLNPTVAMAGFKYRVKNTQCSPAGILSAEATLTVNEVPVITESPVDAAVCVSGDASFSVIATSSNAITYQWQYHNGAAWTDLSNSAIYSGVTEATLLASGVDNTLAEFNGATGDYLGMSIRCIVTSNGCAVNTGEDRLIVHVEPTFVTQPKDYIDCVNVGTTRSTTMYPALTLSDSGMPFQWEYDDGTGFVTISDDAVYSGTNKRVLTFTDASAIHSGKYRVKISNCAATVYSDEAAFTLDEKAVITVQPVNPQIKVCEGKIVEYTATATGTNLTYQWQFSGSDIADDQRYSGTTSSTLIIDTNDAGNFTGQYRCVISSNGSCSTNSGSGNLRVYKTPSFSGALADRVECEEGSSVTFSKGATSFTNGVNTYQWQEAAAGSDIFVDIVDGDKFSGTNGITLGVLAPAFIMNGNRYRNSALGCDAAIYSEPGTLTVNQLPLITTSPQSQTVCNGEEVLFTAQSAIGTDVTYQWMVDEGSGTYSNVTSALVAGSDGFSTYTISGSSVLASMNGYKYKCVARGAFPCANDVISESFEATLTVNEVTILTNPEQATVCRGGNASFAITAQGDGLTYQWQESGSDLTDGGVYSGATTATLTITGATTELHGRSYHCVVNGNCTPTSSGSNVLIVNGVDKPEIFADFNNAESPTLSVFNVGGDTYEWFLDGTSLGSGGSSFTIDQAGSYTVIVSVNGCPSEISDPQGVIVTGINQNSLNQVSIFPNPVRDQLIVTLVDIQEGTQIRISSLNGKVKKLIATVGRNNIINMSDLSPGIYVVQVKNSTSTTTYKVIKE